MMVDSSAILINFILNLSNQSIGHITKVGDNTLDINFIRRLRTAPISKNHLDLYFFPFLFSFSCYVYFCFSFYFKVNVILVLIEL